MIERHPEDYHSGETFTYGWKLANKQTKKDAEVDESLAISDKTVFHTFHSHFVSKLMDQQDQDLSPLLFKSIAPPSKRR